jgi:hypothetical protein
MTKSTDIPTKPFNLDWDDDIHESPYSTPEHEPRPNKALTFKNKTTHIIRIGQINSDWDHVNFVIENGDKPETEKQKELSVLEPGDTIIIQFLKPELIEP